MPGANAMGPIWSKKMKGPTMRRRATGSTRPTSNPPRSRRRCSMTSWIIRASCIAAAAAHEALPADDDGGSVREGGADDVPWVTFECERTNRTEPSTNPRTRVASSLSAPLSWDAASARVSMGADGRQGDANAAAGAGQETDLAVMGVGHVTDDGEAEAGARRRRPALAEPRSKTAGGR